MKAFGFSGNRQELAKHILHVIALWNLCRAEITAFNSATLFRNKALRENKPGKGVQSEIATLSILATNKATIVMEARPNLAFRTSAVPLPPTG